ncbi:MAG: hypothetical protein A2X84_00145 [Desulfuromonadaceae bacterium GWC2_58_13]|nr:MAG: hypothetical protein A2X84_00145 [Desulfuromonadaceae bacterium GWC2_58_13]
MEDLRIYEEIIRLKKARIPAALAMVVESSGSSPRKAGAKMLVSGVGAVLGTVGGGRIEAETLQAAVEVLREGAPRTLPFTLTEEHGFVCGGRVLVYIEPIGLPLHLVAVGSGHVGQALARAARQAGFKVTLTDPHPPSDRQESPDFAPADLVCPVEEIFSRVPMDSRTYILIATRDHQHDFVAVKHALTTEACYIGLVGSRRKKSALHQFLLEEGFSPESIDRIVTPAGLDICAQTPEEIAISITAQLIQRRRSHAASSVGHSVGCGTFAADGPVQTSAAAR